MRPGLSGVAASPSGRLWLVGSPSKPASASATAMRSIAVESCASWNSVQST